MWSSWIIHSIAHGLLAWLLMNFNKCILHLLNTVQFCFGKFNLRHISVINSSLPLPMQIFQNKVWFHFFCSFFFLQGNSAPGKALLGGFQGSNSGHLNHVLTVYLLGILRDKNLTVNLKGSRFRFYAHINWLGAKTRSLEFHEAGSDELVASWVHFAAFFSSWFLLKARPRIFHFGGGFFCLSNRRALQAQSGDLSHIAERCLL